MEPFKDTHKETILSKVIKIYAKRVNIKVYAWKRVFLGGSNDVNWL